MASAGPSTLGDVMDNALTPDTAIAEMGMKYNWASLQQANILTAKEYDVIVHLLSYSLDERGEEVMGALIGALSKMTAVEPMQYTLMILDKIFTEKPERTTLVHSIANKQKNDAVYTVFLRLLNRSDAYVRAKSLRVICALLSTVEGNVSAELLDGLFASLYSALRRPDDEANLLSSLSAFMILLRKTSMRAKFLRDQGLQMLLPLITSKAQNIQIIYQTLYCCWLLTFDKQAASAAFKDSGVINLINQILKTHQKEKVIRIALATLKELFVFDWAANQMVDQGLVKTLHNLLIHKWVDEDLQQDLGALTEQLNDRVAALISVDVYARELEKGQLDWTPVHKSEKFWKENYTKFDCDNFHMLRVLGALLYSDHPRTLAVVCHDLGNFSRFHPRGKQLLEAFGLKTRVMQLLTHENPEVQKEALVCVQKMLVQRWESLSNSLASIGAANQPAVAASAPASSKPVSAITNPLDKAIPQGPASYAAASPPPSSARAPPPAK